MQQQIANFLARRWSVPPGGLAVDVRPIPGGLESRVARASVLPGRHHGREPRRFVVKELSGRHRHESRIYRWLWTEVDTPPAARMLGVESVGENEYLYLEDVRPAHDWPWSNTAVAASVCRELARLHDAAARPSDVFEEWDYGAELERSAKATLESALTSRDPAGVRYWRRPGELRRVIATLPSMRARLMETGTTVIHGDVHPGNVIVEAIPGGHRVALIDWARARIGSPLEDATPFMGTTQQPVEIRRMQASDIHAVAGLCGQLGYPATADQITARWSLLADDSGHAVFVAADGRRVIGWLHVAHRLLLEYDACAEICGLVVDERERGAGVGRALVAAAEAWARAAGARTLRVRSRVERDRAHAFYERDGYTRVKTQHVFEKALA